MLYLLGEGHEVALAEATPEGYREHGRFKIEGHGKPVGPTPSSPAAGFTSATRSR